MNMTMPPSIPAKKMRVVMARLHGIRSKLGSKKTDFNACSGGRLWTFSTFVKLNQSYENISIGFYYCADYRSVPGLVSKERGSNHCYLDHGYDPRHGVDDQEELDHEEDSGFDG